MGVAAMQGADQHIRSSLGFSVLPKDTSTCRPGESNQRPSNNMMLALPLSHSRPFSSQFQMRNVDHTNWDDFKFKHNMVRVHTELLMVKDCYTVMTLGDLGAGWATTSPRTLTGSKNNPCVFRTGQASFKYPHISCAPPQSKWIKVRLVCFEFKGSND